MRSAASACMQRRAQCCAGSAACPGPAKGRRDLASYAQCRHNYSSAAITKLQSRYQHKQASLPPEGKFSALQDPGSSIENIHTMSGTRAGLRL